VKKTIQVSKLIFKRLVDKLRSGLSPEEFKNIIASEHESDNDFKEGDIFDIGPLDTGYDENDQESEIAAEATKTDNNAK